MGTRKLGISLGAAVLLLGMPTSYALAGQGEGKGEGKPDKPGGVHQCEDGEDNDGSGDGVDYPDDPDCGSPRDNSEGPDEDETEEPGGETPALPAELQAVVDEVLAAVGGGGEDPGEEEPPAEEEPGEGEPPAGPPALPVDPATLPAEIQAAIEALLEQLPPADPAALQEAIEEAVGQLPPPPA